MHCHPAANQNQGAFRPLDVAAIVCVVSVLAFFAVFGTGRFKERMARIHCRANLMQIGTALQLYAKDNHDLLPDCSRANPRLAGPNWPWDTHTNLVNFFEAKGATRQNLYCPANPAMNDDRHWNFWKSDPNPARVTGYGLLLNGYSQVPRNLWRTSLNATNQSSPALTELGFDATVCTDDKYVGIGDAWSDRSNHVRGNRPMGGNILFEDQHVAWRDFGDMLIRFTTFNPAGAVQWSF